MYVNDVYDVNRVRHYPFVGKRMYVKEGHDVHRVRHTPFEGRADVRQISLYRESTRFITCLTRSVNTRLESSRRAQRLDTLGKKPSHRECSM